MARYLTKSLFKKGDECPTKLFYARKETFPDTNEDNEFMRGLAKGGYQVGEYAKLHFPGGVEIVSRHKEEASARTAQLLQQDNVVIYEAALKYGDQLYALVDILVKKGNTIRLIEVKSKQFDVDADSFWQKRKAFLNSAWRPYLLDVAFQTWLARKAFPQYEFIPELMLLNKQQAATLDGLNTHFKIVDFVDGQFRIQTRGEVSLEKLGASLLITLPVGAEVDALLSRTDSDLSKRHPAEPRDFEGWVNWLAAHYQQDEPITPQLTAACKHCEYRVAADQLQPGQQSGFERCWQRVAERPLVFDLWNYAKASKFVAQGIYGLMHPVVQDDLHLADIHRVLNKQEAWTAQERQVLQVYCQQHGITEEIVNPGLRGVMQACRYPLQFIDFEAGILALPFNIGHRPYEKVAFQFSIHTLHEDGRLEHSHEWISVEPGVNPNPAFVKALQQALEPLEGTLLCYSKFEVTTLRQLKDQLTDYPHLQRFLDRQALESPFVDMLELVKKYYYHPATGGSNSIKYVLPAIVKTNLYAQLPPIPSYRFSEVLNAYVEDDEEQVNDGGKAMMAWAELQFTDVPDERRTQVKQALLRYCELDTEAMAKIWMHWMRVVY